MFILQATKNCLICQERELLTSGSVNVNQVQFNFNADWDGLSRTAVFQAGDTPIEKELTQTNTCYIPWEVLKSARRMCYAGVYGTDADGNVVLPTIWASLGEIRCGTTRGKNQQPPTPDMYDQLKAIADQAEQIAQSVRDDADAGKFDGAPGAPGPEGPPGKGVPEITEADAGKYLQAGADGNGKWDSPVVFIDSEAAGIKWLVTSPETAVVTADVMAQFQDAFDNHKPLIMSADVQGVASGTMMMTATGDYDRENIRGMMFTGALYLGDRYFGALLLAIQDQSAVVTQLSVMQPKDGEDGATFTPAVSTAGIISWTNDKGLPNPTPVNIMGPEGKQGPQGNPGPATTITIGATTTTEPGTDASVTSTPTDDGIQLAFSIPRGQEGQTGPEGKQGIQGEPGPATVVSVAETVTGQPGTDASVAATATEDGIALHFTIPRGTPGGAEIDDDAINPGQAWSSRKIVDTLAPAFEISGAAVSCWPIAGYPLHVVSQVTASQPGTGDPSFENVRPISGWTAATVTHNDTPVTLPFGQTVYGGTLDWQSGVLTITYAMADMSTFTWSRYAEHTNVYGFYCVPPNSANFSYNLAKSDKLKYIGSVANHVEGFTNGDDSNRLYVYINKTRLPGFEVDSLNAFLAENPITLVYLLASPTTVQLTPQEMLALSGENTIYTDTGDTTVSGRADPNAVIQQLTARIAALEGKAIATN